MSSGIELADLRNKPFLDVEESRSQRPVRAYVFLAVEVFVCAQTIYSYERLSQENPLLAPSVLGSATAALAQSVIQFFKHTHSTSRILKFTVWGCINGYFTAVWLSFLVTRINNVLYQVLVDQALGAPVFQLVFTILSTIWENDALLSANTRISYTKSLRYSYCYWPFVSASTFMFVPPRLMFVSNCLANFIWNVVLSRLG